LLQLKESSIPYYNITGILTLENIFKLKLAIFAHKISNDQTDRPEAFNHFLVRASDVHGYNTRFAANSNFYRPIAKTNYGKHDLKFTISKIYEEIPARIKYLDNNQFKKQYKRFLLQSQN
jgi:hypothetical protein